MTVKIYSEVCMYMGLQLYGCRGEEAGFLECGREGYGQAKAYICHVCMRARMYARVCVGAYVWMLAEIIEDVRVGGGLK